MYPIPANKRDFKSVTSAVNNSVFSVARFRKINGGLKWKTLGSGFFVSDRGHFLTCHHVLNSQKNPHKDGDGYRLICRLSDSKSSQFATYDLKDVKLDTELFLNPDKDAAILHFEDIKIAEKKLEKATGTQQGYLRLNSSIISDGQEIGVMGYPLANLKFRNNDINRPIFNSFIQRVSKDVISSQQFFNEIKSEEGIARQVDIVEVNFLFVPGNSGGPIYDPQTGEVMAYVGGFRSIIFKNVIKQLGKKTFLERVKNIIKGVPIKFVDVDKAIFSYGLSVSNIKSFLAKFNIKVN